MPTEKAKNYFVFSVMTKKEASAGGLGTLVSDIASSRLTLRGLCGFVSARRAKAFGILDDANAFRAFAKKRRLRIVRKTAEGGSATISP